MQIFKHFVWWIESKKKLLTNILRKYNNINNRKKNKKTVILFISHIYSDAVVDKFLKIRKSTANDFDSFALIDASNKFTHELWKKQLEQEDSANALIPFFPDELEKILGYKYFIKDSIIPGCAHYPLLFFWKQFEYLNYWVIEYDVDYTGDWSNLFNSFNNNIEDLLASHLTRRCLHPTWQWWESLHPPRRFSKAIKAKHANLLKAFCPLYRISERALRAIDAAHKQKWRGHCEVLLPVILEENNLIVGDFNAYGTFYTNGSIEPNGGTTPHSSLRWRPEIDPLELKKVSTPCIWHPVK